MSLSFEQLRRECESVRNAAYRVFQEKTISHFCIAEFPKGWCGCLSRVLGAALSKKYPEEEFYYVCGEINGNSDNWTSHAWIRYEDLILDITADQFDGITESIIITRISESLFHSEFEITNEHLAEKSVEHDYEKRIIMLKKYEMEKNC